MKTSKFNRILSALLALVLFISNFPMTAGASDGFSISCDGKPVSRVEFFKHEKLEVSAENLPEGCGYQWQIRIPGTDTWVDIHGQTGRSLKLTYALLGSLLDGEQTAQVRCGALKGGSAVEYTAALTATVTEKPEEAPAAVPETTAPAETETVEETTAPTVAETVPETTAPAETEAVEETTAPTVAETVPETTAPAETEAVEETTAPTVAETVPETTAPAETEAVEETTAPTVAETVPETTAPAETEAVEETTAPTVAETVPETTAPAETEAVEETTAPTVAETEPPRRMLFAAPRSSGVMAAAEGEETEIVTVTIHYRAVTRDDKFVTTGEDADKQENAAKAEPAADSYVAHIISGSNLDVTVPCRVIPGYKLTLPTFDHEGLSVDGNDLKLDLTNVTQDLTFYAYYKEEQVSYSARYFMQNVYNDLHTERTDILTEEIRQKMKGYPGDEPDGSVIYPEINGFSALFFQPDTIAADGSTVFEVYYDRNYYLINFDMDGGFGTAPVYARFESSFTVSPPTKPGYSFDGWEMISYDIKEIEEDDDTETVAAKNAYNEALKNYLASAEKNENGLIKKIPYTNVTYKAKWIQQDTTYTVAYWILDDKGTDTEADDTKTYLGNQKKSARSGTSVSGKADLKKEDGTSIRICGNDTHEHKDETCYIDPVDLRYMDFVKADQNVTVEGDGSTVVNVYYEYREYTLRFYYARTKGGTDSLDDADNIPDANFTNIEVAGGSTWYFGSKDYSINTDKDADLLKKVGNWGAIQSFPQLKRNEGVYKKSALQVGDYYYHYLSFTARYGDDISTRWPCDVIAPAERSDTNGMGGWAGTTAFVSAWNGEHRVKYTRDNGNPTIKGLYERLDENLLFDKSFDNQSFEDKTTVSYLCFWENGAGGVGWNVPELYIYNIWLPCLDNDPEKAPIDDPLTGKRKETKNYNGTYYYLEKSYHTCDDSDIESQTEPSLTGYVYKETEWWAIFLSQTTENTNTNGNVIYTGKGNKQASYNSSTKIVEDAGDKKWKTLPRELKIEKQTDGTYLVYDEERYDPKEYADDLNHIMYREAYYRDFFYEVNKHTLSFWNHDGNLESGSGLLLAYGTPLKKYGDYVNEDYMLGIGEDPYYHTPNQSHYPATLEPDAYYFDGWYTSKDCLPGTEMDWNDGTMPDADLIVYAHWVPIEHDTYFYLDYDRYEKRDPKLGNDPNRYLLVEDTPHGTAMINPPDIPKHDEYPDYKFVGWFYIDGDGTKKAFNPAEMAVRKELHLFAEWTTTEVSEYRISYQQGVLDESTGEYVAVSPAVTLAEDHEGYALEATTKTFTAKDRDQLTKLPEGMGDKLWLPHTNSHSIVMRPDSNGNGEPDENSFTFYYVMKENAPYTVRYLDQTSHEPVYLDTEGKEIVGGKEQNDSAVVTETFVYIPGYVPDAFHKSLVLSANGSENEIIFYYTKDDVIDGGDVGGGGSSEGRSRYLVTHHVPELDGTTYTSRNPEDNIGVVGEPATATALELPGFEFDEVKTKEEYKKAHEESSVEDNVKQNDDGKWTVSGIVTTGADEDNKPLELHLYYKRKMYGYTVLHKDRDTGAELKRDTVGIEAGQEDEKVPFEQVVSVTAKESDMKGYELFGAEEDGTKTQKLTISWDEKLNVITFYYIQKKVTIRYEPVCTMAGVTGFGGVSKPLDYGTTISGSEAHAASGFRFLGWYQDWGTNGQTQVTTDARYIPKIDTSTGIYDYTYYAVFEPIPTSLKIVKTVQGALTGNKDSFLFRITGKANTSTKDVNMIVAINGNGSVIVENLNCGEYTVTELTDWSWKYDCGESVVKKTITEMSGSDIPETNIFNFTNTYKNPDWLGGENYRENIFS